MPYGASPDGASDSIAVAAPADRRPMSQSPHLATVDPRRQCRLRNVAPMATAPWTEPRTLGLREPLPVEGPRVGPSGWRSTSEGLNGCTLPADVLDHCRFGHSACRSFGRVPNRGLASSSTVPGEVGGLCVISSTLASLTETRALVGYSLLSSRSQGVSLACETVGYSLASFLADWADWAWTRALPCPEAATLVAGRLVCLTLFYSTDRRRTDSADASCLTPNS